MDDLRQLDTLLAKPEPSGEIVERGRRQLTQAIDATAHQRPAGAAYQRPARAAHPARLARRRRVGWLAAGLGLTAAATAAIIVLTSGGTTPGRVASGGTPPAAVRSPGPGHPGPSPAHPIPVSELSGRQVLLAAAATALKQHPGAYWHYKITLKFKNAPPPPPGVPVVNSYESWIAKDGRYWNAQPRCAAPPGTAVFEGPGLGPVINLTYKLAQHLPTSPAALTAWFAKYNPHDRYGPGFVPGMLISLQYQIPAPPKVRAAAFLALAGLPGVKSLGPVKGGVGLRINPPGAFAYGGMKLVVDPATALVRSETVGGAVTVIKKAQWTNRLPRVIPLPPKDACGT
jgi:hypothetical protein